ncbi:MAG: dihydrolipoyl dehydrogenase [Chitinivibrionales bacterium]|nr:dihydrolipoyl dehydrogenase [Chitinivibrionales bacterium]
MYDLVILGGGPAGYLAAERAGEAGLNTALIEKGHLGGVCLNEGCVPSKTILYSSKLYSQARHSEAFGVSVRDASFDLQKVMARKEKVVGMLRKGIASTLKKKKVTVVGAEGVILPRTDNTFRIQAGTEVVEGKKLLICTGSEAIRIPIPGADRPDVYTNREILSVDHIPERFVVIGGGVIGLEIANFFAEVGSRVTVIELLPAIGGPVDIEIASALRKEMEKKEIEFKLDSKVVEIGEKSVVYEAEGKRETAAADIVLMSVGRRPVTRRLGFENLNLFIDRGAIRVDERGRTNVPGVWAAGDVNGMSMLAHTAYREGEVCINDILGKKDRMRYDAVPGVIYTHPEVATIGYTQQDAAEKGIPVTTAKLPMSYSGRYLAENEGGRGFCKVVVNSETRALIGVHMIGSICSEMIYGTAPMIENELRVEDVAELVFPHPTVSEIIKDTIRQVK